MIEFEDGKGRSWEIRLTYGALVEIKDRVGIDILGAMSQQATKKSNGKTSSGKQETETLDVTDLIMDIERFVNALYVVVSDQHADVTDVEFGKSLTPEAIRDAYEGFFSELQDFFRVTGRAPWAAQIAKQMEAVRLGMEMAEQEISEYDLSEKMHRELSSLSGKTLES